MLFAVRLSQPHQGPILPHCASQSWRANPLFVTNHLLKQIHNAVTAQLVSVVVTLQVVERFSFAVPVRRPLSLRLPRHAIRLPNCPSQKCNCVIRLPVAILAHTSCSARLLSAGGNSHAATSVLNGVRSRQTMLTEKICVKYQRLSTTPHLAIAQIFRINLWRKWAMPSRRLALGQVISGAPLVITMLTQRPWHGLHEIQGFLEQATRRAQIY